MLDCLGAKLLDCPSIVITKEFICACQSSLAFLFAKEWWVRKAPIGADSNCLSVGYLLILLFCNLDVYCSATKLASIFGEECLVLTVNFFIHFGWDISTLIFNFIIFFTHVRLSLLLFECFCDAKLLYIYFKGAEITSYYIQNFWFQRIRPKKYRLPILEIDIWFRNFLDSHHLTNAGMSMSAND